MIGEKLGSFKIEAILGTGAMGVVYRAVSETTGRPAAVKVISGELSQNSRSFDRFRREAEILKQFRHSNIVRFLAVGRYQGTSYFAMEYVAGETLEQRLRREGPHPWRDVVDLAIQLCQALQYAHDHGVVHRDLKPSNLMISEQGQIKLTDFGIAKDLDATALTATGRTLGTAAYMAPEQIRGTPEISHKTDLYALGAVLYQLLTGRIPFDGASAVVLMHAHINQAPPRPSARVAEIPIALDKLIVQLMAKDPTERPWDAAAVEATLTEIRDKSTRGESVPMVWATQDQVADPLAATLGATNAVTIPTKSAKTTKAKRRRKSEPEEEKSKLELVGLLAGLLLVGGLIAYIVWPPSAPYLYRKAEELMKSDKPADWRMAQERYLDPLDQRFKDHPYQKTTQKWRDQLALREVEERARILESDVRSFMSEPKNAMEHAYQAYYKLAKQASEDGDDLRAVTYWQEMDKKVNLKEPEERPWHLLALKRIESLTRLVKERQEVVRGLIELAIEADRNGRPLEAASIRNDLVKRFSRYSDLQNVFASLGLTSETAEGNGSSSPKEDNEPPTSTPKSETSGDRSNNQ